MAKLKRKVNKYLPLVILVTVLGLGFYFLRSRNGVPKVEVVKPEFREIAKTISASGYTGVTEGFTVRAGISGTINKVKVKSGDAVKLGDVVLEFDLASLQASLDSAYATYLGAKADLESYDQRITSAKATEDIRKRERDEAWRAYMADNDEDIKQAYKNAEALYQTALASLKILEDDKQAVAKAVTSGYSSYYSSLVNYQNGVVKAPADGLVALADIYTGSYVTVGQELFAITGKDKLVFKAEIDEADVSHVSVGMKAKVNLDSYPGEVFTGEITALDSKVVTLTNGSTAIMADISFDTSKVMPVVGFGGSADIEIEKSENLLSLPPEAFFDESDKTYIYTVVQNSVVKTEVQKGFEGDEFIGVVSGLSQEALVIADPASLNLKVGQKVKL